MATTTVTVSGWTLACAGACRIDRQRHTLGATPTEKALIEAAKDPILVYVGTVLPVGDIQEAHMMTENLLYAGTENVYLNGNGKDVIVVVTPII